jgi:hypothetical protein
MKALYVTKERADLENAMIEALKEIEDLKDYIEKLNKINAHLVNELMIETGLKEKALV